MSRFARVRTIYGYFAADVRERRAKLVGGACFAVVYAVARVVEPWPLKVVIDQVLFHKPARGVLLQPFTAFGSSPYSLLAAAGTVLALTGLVRGAAYYYEDFFLSSAAQEIVYSIRGRLYRHLNTLPLAFHQRRRRGDLLVRLSADIVVLRDVLVDTVVDLGTGVVLLVLMLAVMLAVDPVLTAIALGVMPVITLLSLLYGPRIRATAKMQRKREGQVSAAMHEALAAIDVVQLHGAAEREQERFRRLNKKSLKQGTQSVRVEARMNQSVEIALAGGTVVVLWAGTVRALHGAITPGELIVFVSYLRAAYRPLRRASKSVQRSAKALAAAERIVEVLETESELPERPDAKLAPPLTGRVAFEGVAFSYGTDALVLEDIRLALEPGRTLAIVGETGSGKSTLVSLVPRLFDPIAGRVTVDEIDVRDLTLESLRAQISVVRQESVLFGLSIAENIRYGCPDASDKEVAAAAAAAGVDRFVDDLPNGYDTVLSERGASLSGGQRQRVALARALVRRSPILILDEPTTGLDAATQQDVIGAIRELTSKSTTLVVTHDLELARQADEIAVLDRGRLVARGSYRELLAGSSQFRRLACADDNDREPRTSRTREPVDGRGDGWRVRSHAHNGDGVGHLQRQLDLAGFVLDRGRLMARETYHALVAGSPQLRRLVVGSDDREPRTSATPEAAAGKGAGRRVLFYSHNGVGVGHLQRQLDLATAYKERHPDAAVLLATGSYGLSMFDFPEGIDFLKLPSLQMIDRYRNWRSRELPLPISSVVTLRSELLERTVKHFAPDLLVADFMPAGPYGELRPALEQLERGGGRAIAGFRDIIDEPAFVRKLWADTGVYDTLRRHYSAICVYGDPRVTDFVEQYGLDDALAPRLRYCGYLGRRLRRSIDVPIDERPFVIATCGGGADGPPLIEAYIHAAATLRSEFGGTWLAVTGPLMHHEEHLRLARLAEPAGVTVRRIVPELRAHVAVADCVVSMPGYNTVCDLLSFCRPTVVAPRRGPSREQALRARCLAELGLAEVVLELSADSIGLAVEHALTERGPQRSPLALDGIDRALDAFDETIERAPRTAVAAAVRAQAA